jgi:hypothetical protein
MEFDLAGFSIRDISVASGKASYVRFDLNAYSVDFLTEHCVESINLLDGVGRLAFVLYACLEVLTHGGNYLDQIGFTRQVTFNERLSDQLKFAADAQIYFNGDVDPRFDSFQYFSTNGAIREFFEMGMDFIATVDFSGELGNRFSMSLHVDALFHYLSIGSLARYIVEQLAHLDRSAPPLRVKRYFIGCRHHP